MPPATVNAPTSATRGPAEPASSQPSARFAASAAPSAAAAPCGKKSAKRTSSPITSTDAAIVELRATTMCDSSRSTVRGAFESRCAVSMCGVCSAVRATSAIDTSPGTRVRLERSSPW